MASRVFSGLQVIGPNRVRITGVIVFGQSGEPSVRSGYGFTVSRDTQGTISLTFDDFYSEMEYVNMNFTSCNVNQLKMVSVSISDFEQEQSKIVFLVGNFVVSGFVPGDPSNGDELSVEFIMKNTGITGV